MGPSLGYNMATRKRGSSRSRPRETYDRVGCRQNPAVPERAIRIRENFAAIVWLFAVGVLDVIDTVSVGLPLSGEVSEHSVRCVTHLILTTSTVASLIPSPLRFFTVPTKAIDSPCVLDLARDEPEGTTGASSV